MGSASEPGAVSARVGPYSSELECDVETMRGSTLHLRPIRPDDGGRLIQFHEHLSLQSVYRRFFFMHLRLSTAEVERFTHVDYVDRLALVVEHADDLVGVGRYERQPRTQQAEVAFVVADQFQHHGIGTILLEHLAEAALDNGINTFTAQTLADNQDMLDVFMKSGFHVTSTREYGTVSVRFSIEPDDASRSAYNRRHHSEDQRFEPGASSPC
jgi:GNAT superfamily N-acetyltransferase